MLFPRFDDSSSFGICPEMDTNEMHKLYDRHHKMSLTLHVCLLKTQIILSNMKSYENDKKLSYMKYPNSALGAFLDIQYINKWRLLSGGGLTLIKERGEANYQ